MLYASPGTIAYKDTSPLARMAHRPCPPLHSHLCAPRYARRLRYSRVRRAEPLGPCFACERGRVGLRDRFELLARPALTLVSGHFGVRVPRGVTLVQLHMSAAPR